MRLTQEVRYAVRALRADGRFTLMAVATLALGIGVNAVLIATAQVVVSPLPADNPSEVFLVTAADPGRGRERTRLSPAEYLDLAAQLRSFHDLAAFDIQNLTLTGMREPMRVNALLATPGLFSLWQTRPALGRTFVSGEEHSSLALVSHSFWQRSLGGDGSVIGRSLALDGRNYTVIGVLTAANEFGLLRSVDIWIPLSLEHASASRESRSLIVSGRLTSDGAARQAAVELETVAARLAQEHPATNEGVGFVLVPLIEGFGSGGNTRLILAFIGLLGLLVLAVACANVGSLMVARGIVRQREVAVRLALGATRRMVLRYQLVEALFIAGPAGLAGLLLAAWGVDLLKLVAGTGNPFFDEIAVNGRTVLATLTIVFLTPLAFALLPALQSARLDLTSSLRVTAGDARRSRLRTTLVVAQIAMGAVLLVVVGLLVKSVLALHAIPVGFQPRGLLTFRIEAPAFKYPADEQVRRFHEQLAERLGDVGAVAAIDRLPIEDRERTAAIAIRGRAPAGRRSDSWAALATVTPAYRDVMGIALVRGRDLSMRDGANAPPVALISRFMAERYWPGADPIGQAIRIETGGEEQWREIVGVVGDVRNSDPDAGLVPQVYVPHAQRPGRMMAVVLRGTSDVLPHAAAIQQAVSALDADVPIFDLQSMRQVLFDDMADGYVLGAMLMVFALITVALGASGVYGMVAYSVAQRRREIGIRLAVGATTRHVRSLVLKEGITVAITGTAVGAIIGYALGRLLSRALYGVGPGDPVVFVLTFAVLVGTSLAASYVPARRAAGTDPAAALKVE